MLVCHFEHIPKCTGVFCSCKEEKRVKKTQIDAVVKKRERERKKMVEKEWVISLCLMAVFNYNKSCSLRSKIHINQIYRHTHTNYAARPTMCSLTTGCHKTGECFHLNCIMGKEDGKKPFL